MGLLTDVVSSLADTPETRILCLTGRADTEEQLGLADQEGRHVKVVGLRSGTTANGDRIAREASGLAPIDIDAARLVSDIVAEPWNVIVLDGVIDVLADPGRLLTEIAAQGVLAHGGRIIVTVRNGAHQSIVAQLLTSGTAYGDGDLSVSGPRRWFTLAGIRRFLDQHGLKVTAVHRMYSDLDSTAAGPLLTELDATTELAVSTMGVEGQAYEYVLVTVPADSGMIAELDESLRGALERERELSRRVGLLEGRLADAQALLTEERSQAIADLKAGAAELQSQSDQINSLKTQLATARAQLSASERARAGTNSQLAASERKLEQLAAELAAAGEGLKQARVDLDQAQKRIDGILNSRSYRAARALSGLRSPKSLLRHAGVAGEQSR